MKIASAIFTRGLLTFRYHRRFIYSGSLHLRKQEGCITLESMIAMDISS